MAALRSLLIGIFAVSVCAAQSINISGQVTDTGGTPLPGAIVTLVNAGLTATTGGNGSFTLTSTSVSVRRQNNQLPTHGLSAGIYNGVLYVNLQEESDVDITTFTLQGKAVSTLRRTMGAGTNSLALPRMGAGVYLYKVKFGGSEFMIKSPLIDGISHGTVISVQGSSFDALAKRAKNTATFNDAILVTKDGYLSYRMMITNSDTSGIEIKMMVGTGLVIVGLQRMIVMKDIPAGTFTMGSDSAADIDASPAHQVTLSAFKMQETDVTQEQYLAVMGTNPSHFDAGTGASLRPVEMVRWYDAVQFCNALSAISGLTPVYDTSTWTADFSKTGYRLPTEAQWEYVCQAGSTTEYWWGPDTNGMGGRTWSYYNSGGTTQPVATKLANSYGLYDITGNVWQWCNDWYGVYTAGAATDPTGAATGTYRVVRGGSWHDSDGVYFRSADRAYYDLPDFRDNDNGFRVVLPR
jgi:formylglycine-generating enzyme required for sulfatase activity